MQGNCRTEAEQKGIMKNHILKYMERLDSLTFNHSARVMMIASEIEEYMGVLDHKLMNAALFHDIGKIYVPYNILDKNGRLTKLERELVDLHPYSGYIVLSDLGVDEDICRIVLYHHGFSPLYIRDLPHYNTGLIYQKTCILRTIDSFEALTSDRAYHRGLPSRDAIDILLKEGIYDVTAMEYLKKMSESDNEETAVRRKWKELSFEEIENIIKGMEL